MENEKICEQEVWSAIRYLDPDEQKKNHKTDTATIITILALLLVVVAVWILLWLR